MATMDTVKVILFRPGAEKYIIGRVRKFGTRWFQKGNTEKVEAFSRKFKHSQEWVIRGQRLHVEWGKRNWVKTKQLMELTFHLSHHKTIEDFLKWAKVAFGQCLPLVIDGLISRFDCCADFFLPYDFVQNNLYQPRGRNDRKFEQGKRTLYLGAYPKRTRAYERDIPLDQIDYGAPKKSPEKSLPGVRIEVETFRERKPIQSLRQLERLREIDPFSHLKFLAKDRLIVDSNLPLKTKTLLWAFENRSREVGAHQAIKEFNKNGNFSRTIEKHYRPLQSNILLKAWKRRVKRYLGAGPISFPEPLTDFSFLEKHQVTVLQKKSESGASWKISGFDDVGGSHG